jgi:hypothetical protein
VRRIEPVIKVAALMGAIIGERWLRGQIRRGIVEKSHAKSLKPLPKSPTPSYRSASSWTPGSDIASVLERPKRWSKR